MPERPETDQMCVCVCVCVVCGDSGDGGGVELRPLQDEKKLIEDSQKKMEGRGVKLREREREKDWQTDRKGDRTGPVKNEKNEEENK